MPRMARRATRRLGILVSSVRRLDRRKIQLIGRDLASYLPVLIYLVFVIGFAAVSLAIPHWIAPRRPTKVKNMPYESGMDPSGDTRRPLTIKFYLIAILFMVFDVELLFLYPWAVALNGAAGDGIPDSGRGAALLVMVILIATLGLAYLVAWRKGVFDWRKL